MNKPPLIDRRPPHFVKSLKKFDDLSILVPYNKPPIQYQDQVKRLQERGLSIPNETKLLHLLKKVNYYRLSGYWYPLLEDKINHKFKKGASFEIAYKIYRFDRELRQLVARELEKVEVAVRAQMAYVVSHSTSSPFWYTDDGLFDDVNKFTGSIEAMHKDFMKSDAQFMKSFRRKYINPMPPCWMMFELISFGSLSMMFENMKNTPQKRQIAEYFGLDKSTFTSWLHSFVYIRNVCAHHSRLWNRQLGIQAQHPKTPTNTWLNNRNVPNTKCYFAFSMILYLLQTVDPKNKFQFKFRLLLKKYPNIDIKALGFPIDEWENEPLWNFKPTFGQRLRLLFRL